MTNQITDDKQVRTEQFMKTLALAHSAFKQDNFIEAKYWLLRARMIVGVIESYTVEIVDEEVV